MPVNPAHFSFPQNGNSLPEENFIREPSAKTPFPPWLWAVILLMIVAIAWGLSSLYRTEIKQQVEGSPFLQVTNRDLSVFLWQHPSLMRINVSNKASYLTGFEFLNKVNIEEGFADQYAVAPPNVLFLYHTWNRLVRNEFAQRAIPKVEFQEFLQASKEWLPENWAKAPEEYKTFVNTLTTSNVKDLQSLSEKILPLTVRQAFIGWKNFFKEGEKINRLKISSEEVEEFLSKFPHYARNYWRNVVGETYLRSVTFGKLAKAEIVPEEEIPPFLRVAVFNFLAATPK